MKTRAIEGTFDVVGATAALSLFGNVRPERLGHGYLFTGVSGVGKKTFALRLARSLVCETPKSGVLGYCNACTGCTLFVAGTHPDVIRHDGTVKIGQESGSALHDEDLTARDLVRELALRPYRSRHRVVVLGDVEFATHEAANALLKIFEEPPSGVVVLLTSSVPQSLIPTIRSRFVEVPFSPLRAEEIERVLAASGSDAEPARAAAANALGSITRAREILDHGGDGVRESSFAWFAAAAAGKSPDASFLRLDDRGTSGNEKRAAVCELVELSRVAVRDWLACSLAGGAPDDVPLLAGDKRALYRKLPERDAGELAGLLGALADVERIAATNVSAGLVVEHLRITLAPVS